MSHPRVTKVHATSHSGSHCHVRVGSDGRVGCVLLDVGLGLRLRRRDQEISSQSPQDLNWAYSLDKISRVRIPIPVTGDV